MQYQYNAHMYSHTEWKVLGEHFISLCDTLPCNYQSTISKLSAVPVSLKDGGVQLGKLITPSATDARKINEKIITYLIVKLCCYGSDTSLVRLCDVLDELIDSTGINMCVQQIRSGMYV